MGRAGRLVTLTALAILTLAACGGDDDDRDEATTPPARDTGPAVTATTAPAPTPDELCRRLTAAEVSEVLGRTYTSTTANGECEYNIPTGGRLVRFVAGYFDRRGFLDFVGPSCPVEERDDGRIVATFCGTSQGTDQPNQVWFDLDGVGAVLNIPGGQATLDQYVRLVEAARG